jgi:hypothetical protein
VLSVECCVLRVACCVLRVACCVLCIGLNSLEGGLGASVGATSIGCLFAVKCLCVDLGW